MFCCTPLDCLLRSVSRPLSWSFRIFLNLVLFYIVLRSIFHLTVLVILMLSSKGINVPILEYIDSGLAALFNLTPKDYENTSAFNSLLMMLSSMLSLALTLMKNILLILGNGKAITGEIPHDKYNLAENTWKSMASDFIIGIHTTFVAVTDFIIGYCAKPFLYDASTSNGEATTIISSAVHLLMCALCCLAIYIYNNSMICSHSGGCCAKKHRTSKTRKANDEDESDTEDDDSVGLKPISRANRHIMQAMRKGYQSDGDEGHFVIVKRPRSRSSAGTIVQY